MLFDSKLIYSYEIPLINAIIIVVKKSIIIVVFGCQNSQHNMFHVINDNAYLIIHSSNQ